MQFVIDFLNDNHNAFTSIGVILTFLATITTLIITRKNNKLMTVTNIITKSKSDDIDRLQLLASQYVSIAKVHFYSSTNNVSNYGYYEKILELSTEIILLLRKNGGAEELATLISRINKAYESLIYTYNCLETCGGKLFSHELDESICTNPYFIKYLFFYAEEKQIEHDPPEKFVGNIEKVIGLFLKINQSEEDVDLFFEQLMGRPERLILQLNSDLDDFVLKTAEHIRIFNENIRPRCSVKFKRLAAQKGK